MEKWKAALPYHSYYFHDDDAVDRLFGMPWEEFPHLRSLMRCVRLSESRMCTKLFLAAPGRAHRKLLLAAPGSAPCEKVFVHLTLVTLLLHSKIVMYAPRTAQRAR